jgi:hypothetical protein
LICTPRTTGRSQAYYDVDRTGVWLGNDPVFTTGAVYRKVETSVPFGGNDLIERVAKAFKDDEALQMFEILKKRLKK